MKKLFLLTLICSSFSCKGQLQYNSIVKELYQFSVLSGNRVKDSLSPNDYNTFTFLVKELISNDTLVSQKYGIYQFESYIEDTSVNIFFKKDNSCEIYDISNFKYFMPKFLDFLNDHSWAISDKDKLKYIDAVIAIYKNRFNSESNVIIEEKHNKFIYYIDFENYNKSQSMTR